MRNLAVIGYPIEHSLSPILHNQIYKALKMKVDSRKIAVNPKDLPEFVRSNRNRLYNVTIPHKEKIINLLKTTEIDAEEIGAVNCVSKLKGYNTDWIGFKKSIHKSDVEIENKDCVIIGAGGAARAIAYALIKSNCNSIALINRSKKRKKNLINWISKYGNYNSTINQGDIIINCTPLGMWPNIKDKPLYSGKISTKQIVIDTIYNPYETSFLQFAKDSGAKVISGLDMFIEQGLASINIWEKNNITQNISTKNIKKILKAKLC